MVRGLQGRQVQRDAGPLLEAEGGEEFYVIKDDPFQVRNLINDPKYQEDIEQLRMLLGRIMEQTKDTGLIPEGMYPELAADKTIYEYAQDELPARAVVAAAMVATSRDPSQLEELQRLCRSQSLLLRYWGATGALVLGEEAAPMKERLLPLLQDPSLDVRAVAAEALGHLGETKKAAPILVDIIEEGNEHESLAAITALESFGREGILPMEEVKALIPERVKGDSNRVIEAIKQIQ